MSKDYDNFKQGPGDLGGAPFDAAKELRINQAKEYLSQIRVTTIRGEVLAEAAKLTGGDRNVSYGPPARNLERAAAMLRAYFGDRSIQSATSADFAAINVIIKLARVATNPTHRDSWTDMAAYAAIGYECAIDVAEGRAQEKDRA